MAGVSASAEIRRVVEDADEAENAADCEMGVCEDLFWYIARRGSLDAKNRAFRWLNYEWRTSRL